MLPGFSSLPDGLGLRPARANDQPFLASLYSSTRDDQRIGKVTIDFAWRRPGHPMIG